MSSTHPIGNYLIGDRDLLELSAEAAAELQRQIGNDLETVHYGIAAIGLMVASIDVEEMGDEYIRPTGMLLDYLGRLAWNLKDLSSGCSTEYRAARAAERAKSQSSRERGAP